MKYWIMSLILLLIPLNIGAQSDNDLADPITLQITAENRASMNYVVDAVAEYITIQVQAIDSEVFDPVIWIVDSANRLIAYNDNLNEGNNAIIENLFLQSDVYTIWIDSFNGVSVGEVEIIIESVDPFNTISSTDESILFISATLPKDTNYRYVLELSENDIVTIHVRDTSNTLDPYLSIIDETGIIYIANDDHQSADLSLNRLDSLISQWQSPADNTYVIEVRDFLGNAGQFELTITIISS